MAGHGFAGIPVAVTDLEGPPWLCRDPCSHLCPQVRRYHQCPAWHRAQVPLQRAFPRGTGDEEGMAQDLWGLRSLSSEPC